MQPVLHITEIAAKKLIETMKSSSVQYLRFGATSGGCNGLQYELTPIQKPEDEGAIVHVDKHHAVQLCSKTEIFIFNTRIDYSEDIMGNRFVFSNPNTNTCGCGATFSPSVDFMEQNGFNENR